MAKTLNIYYAHPMSWYGSTEEAKDIAALAERGKVINPNTADYSRRVENAKVDGWPVMQIFADDIASNKIDVVAFRPFRDGKLGAGVAREILEAQIWGKPIWELYGPIGGLVYINDAAIHPAQFDIAQWAFGDILTVGETRQRAARGQL